MQFWNEILHTAQLGTDKRTIDPSALGSDLDGPATRVAMGTDEEVGTADKEDRFLRIASIAFNYRQAGATPLAHEGLTLPKAGEEERPYCSPEAMLALKDVLSEKNSTLLHYWLQFCKKTQRLVRPDLLPALLQNGVAERSLRPDIILCGGKRAEWLCRLNPEWDFPSGASESTLWQTGTPEQRKELLRQVRLSEPAKGLEWLQQTWPQEDANTRLDLLRQLTTQLADNDIPFLESLSTDKSKKIKEEAVQLLKKIPGSPVVQQYRKAVADALFLKRSKALLGLVNKTSLELRLPLQIGAALFQMGIEKLSNRKEFTDDEFILYQLMQWTPLSFYEEQWQLTTAELVRLFQEDDLGKKLFPALVLSVVHFSDPRLALALMQHSSVFYLDLIPLLPRTQQEYYSNKFFAQSPDNIIKYATQWEGEWGLDLTTSILRHAFKNPYQYNRAFFSRHIHLIPATATGALNALASPDTPPGSGWDATSETIARLLYLKQQIVKAFNR
jgi:hypothetical protein